MDSKNTKNVKSKKNDCGCGASDCNCNDSSAKGGSRTANKQAENCGTSNKKSK